MMLTAWSYGRMAGLYPAAGSAYTYVGRGLHPYCGFVAGWCMFLDYLVIPIVSVIYGAISIQKVVDALAPGWTHQAVGMLGLSVLLVGARRSAARMRARSSGVPKGLVM